MKVGRLMVLFMMTLSLAAILAACGGGGGGGGAYAPNSKANTGSAITVASNVSVVSAQTSSNVASGKPSLMGRMKSLLFSATLPGDLAGTDYEKDKTNVYVQDRTSDGFKDINKILCMVGQTRYDAMINQGPYTALVDQNLCDSNSSDPSNAGQQSQNQSSGANMPDYMRFTVNSYRVDDNSPGIVKIWAHQAQSEHDQAALIFGKAVISEPTSSTNPYGIFTMNFRGYNLPVVLTDTPMFAGALEAVRSGVTGSVLLNFVSTDSHTEIFCGTESDQRAVTLDRLPDGTAGAGQVSSIHTCPSNTSYSSNENFQFAYNDSDFYRYNTESSLDSCLSRTSVTESAWSYGLYNSDGSRVTRDSGFSITGDSGNQYFKASNRGWIGYWGLWTEGTATINNGDTVNKVDFNGNTSTPYTVFAAGGKLKKHTRQTLTLNNIQGIPLSYYEQLESCGTGTQYQVVYNGTDFNKVAHMVCANNNCTWSDYGPSPIDLSNFPQGSLNFWSDSLGGQAQVKLAGGTGPATCSPNSDNGCTTCLNSYSLPLVTDPAVVFYAEQVVNPGDLITVQTPSTSVTLACFDQCPDPGALTTNNAYLASGPTNTYDYTFSTDANAANPMVLVSAISGSTGPVVMSSVNSSYRWGLMSGPLFDPNSTNLSLLQCPWDATQTCSWLAWSVLPVFYTWETGPSSWNQFVTLQDAGGFITPFQAPLNVTYVNSGATYILQYGGFGQLNGIPGKCVNMDTGADDNCSAGGNNIRWVPKFTIPALDPSDGTSLNVVHDQATPATTYFVKPLNIEQRMNEDISGGCVNAGLNTTATGGSYTLPSMGDSFVSDPVSAEPSAPVAPAVIGGVLQ
jgi:hypothetical protein